MTREEALDKLCHSYSGYFDVVRHEEPKGYLVAEAGLHIHSEKYVLVKAAKLEKKIQGAHDFRRLFASTWLQTHRGEGFVQPLSLQLGHESAEMTLHYSKQTLKDTERVFVSPMKFVDV